MEKPERDATRESTETLARTLTSNSRTAGDLEAPLDLTVSDKPSAILPAGPDPKSFPDGGLQAWLVVLGGFCTIFAGFGWINCIGIFQAYYEGHQLRSYSASTIAWITSTESFMMFFWGPVAGKLTDQFGPRIPLLIGSVLHVFGLMMMSLSKKYYQIFLSQSVCSAMGCSFLFFPSVTAAASWFLKRRALAIGLMVSGSSIGGVVLPIMVNHLVVRYGFGWTIRIVAFLFLGVLIIGNLTVKSRLPPSKRPFVFKEFVTPYGEPTFLLTTFGSFLLYLGGFLPFNFVIVEAQANGMSARLAGYLVSIINASSTFGRIVPAYFGDKYGVFNVYCLLTGLGGIFTLAVWLTASGNAGIIVYGLLYGFTSGCSFSIIPAMVARISDVRQLGARSGSLYVASSFGVLIGSPIAGSISKNGFSGLIVFCGVLLLGSTAFVMLARIRQTGLVFLAKA